MRALIKVLSLCVVLAPSLVGCGVATFQPGRGASLDQESSREINDDDVRKAFEAKPQLVKPMRVAFYTFDVSKSDEIEASLRQVPGVSDVYRIPPLMLTGQRRYQEGQGQASAELSMKKLRLIAARAHADVVVVYDYGHKIDGGATGWVALTPLLIPIFFVPFIDRKVDSYLDTYVFDTRNGYLYAHVTAEEKTDIGAVNIYHDDDPTLRAHWMKLLSSTQERLKALTAQATAAGAPPPLPPAPATAATAAPPAAPPAPVAPR